MHKDRFHCTTTSKGYAVGQPGCMSGTTASKGYGLGQSGIVRGYAGYC
jgi:hypothetical protein